MFSVCIWRSSPSTSRNRKKMSSAASPSLSKPSPSATGSPDLMHGSSSDDVQRLLVCFNRGISPAFNRPRRSGRKSIKSSFYPEKSGLETPKAANYGKAVQILKLQDPVAVATPVSDNRRVDPSTKEVTPGVFYGSPVGKPSKKPPQLLRLLHEIHKDLLAEAGSPSRSAIWATFPRQDQALQFTDSHGNKDMAVFTYQDHITGQRRFLSTTYEEFWRRYNRMPPKYRHHYEIIRQGSPCHLYFDLEFNYVANKEANGTAMVDMLLSVLSETILDVYSLEFDLAWTVELDSTTEEKFSRHLVIHIPKAAFKDNSHVGAFVGEVCCRIDKRRDVDDRLNQLYVLKGESRGECHAQLFVDQGVYSRNRSFRLPFSSKAGKTALLLPSGRFKCKEMNEYDIFMNSLICKSTIDCERLLTFGSEMTGHGGSLAVESSQPLAINMASKPPAFHVSGASPFPALDTFVESIACIGGVPGKIRSWYWFSEYGVVVYNISGNRYCERIGRHHKSNNVMYIVDFRTAGYYQKCHDPDCRGYRSPLRPIPRHTIPPEFPLSTVKVSELVNCGSQEHPSTLDSLIMFDKTAERLLDIPTTNRSTQVFNSLSERNLFGGATCTNEENDDEAWWEEVGNIVADMERGSKTCFLNSQIANSDMLIFDETWWEEVEQETQKFEKLTT